MKVLNLRCAGGHGFEGWFGSEADFVRQSEQQLLSCPVCGELSVQRLPSAPRLNLSHASEPPAGLPSGAQGAERGQGAVRDERGERTEDASAQALHAAWMHVVREVVKQTENVGERFPEEARRMHYGETETRPIRGQATAEERAALSEEGIEVFSLPVPKGLDGPTH